jgi:hypothetical protein
VLDLTGIVLIHAALWLDIGIHLRANASDYSVTVVPRMKSSGRTNYLSRVDVMRSISWHRVAFWVALWWFVYSAPTEDRFTDLRVRVEGINRLYFSQWP